MLNYNTGDYMKEQRVHKRYKLRRSLIRFSGKKSHWGRIINISEGGLQIATNMDFEKGETIVAIINSRKMAGVSLDQDYTELKIKIIWKATNLQEQGMKKAYGAIFIDLDDTKNELLHYMMENLRNKDEMSKENVEIYLEKLKKTNKS